MDKSERSEREVCLNDGRVVRLALPDAQRDCRVDLLTLQAGFHRGRIDMVSLALYRALYAIEAIDDQPLTLPPPVKARMEAFAAMFTKPQEDAIVARFHAMNGPQLTPIRLNGRQYLGRPR